MKAFKIIFLGILSLVAIIQCNSQTKKSNPENLKREWKLVSLNSYSKDILAENNVSLSITQEEITAFSGCNTLTLKANFNSKGKVNISDISSTEIQCRNFDIIKIENDFKAFLKNVSDYKINGHFLTLTDKNGKSIKFVAADWD